MGDYRQKLSDSCYVLVTEGDLNMRLSYVASILIQVNDDDVPPEVLEIFEKVRDPLIAKPLVIMGKIVPRDLDAAIGRALARAILDLLIVELVGT